MKPGLSYNQRVFGAGIRGKVHGARFLWLRETVLRYLPDFSSVVEVGCYDGRSIRYLPRCPDRYVGLDADWEGGLELARQNWQEKPEYRFIQCKSPADPEVQACLSDNQSFDIAISLETMEHLPDELQEEYLAFIRQNVSRYYLTTVPVEFGLVFLVKHLIKRFMLGGAYQYSWAEVLYSTLGMTSRVERHQHKGFDWRVYRDQVSRHFDIVEVRGLPFRWLPVSLNISAAIVATPRKEPL